MSSPKCSADATRFEISRAGRVIGDVNMAYRIRYPAMDVHLRRNSTDWELERLLCAEFGPHMEVGGWVKARLVLARPDRNPQAPAVTERAASCSAKDRTPVPSGRRDTDTRRPSWVRP